MKNDDEYKTSDLALATALVSAGYKLEAIDRSDGHKALFIFENTIGVKKHVGYFWDDLMKVNPRAYFANLKALKSRLYNEAL